MRPDLAKCTTESPRSGGGMASCYKLKFGGRVPAHPDPEHDYPNECGGFKSSARHRHYECKNFTDCLGALRGNIRKSVGRPWDAVFSEFCQILDRRGLSGHHIWTHLMWEVELNTIFLDGEVYSSTKQSGYRGDPITGYYVHPITGILEYKPQRNWRKFRREREKKEKRDIIKLADGADYQKIGDLWFHFSYGKRQKFNPLSLTYYEVKTVKKRSANRKEIAWIKAQLVVV